MTHHDVHRLRSLSLALQDILAVGVGFEPTKVVKPCQFSRLVLSAVLSHPTDVCILSRRLNIYHFE